MDKDYQHKKIETSVQNFWGKNNSFRVVEDINKKKFFCLSMLPYPSGNLHIGHVRNYVISDVISRYQRMLGKNVLHPIGWDAFGLPAEKAAIQNHISPDKWTSINIKNMKKQFIKLGCGFDWSREINTSNPNYYKWEQSFFIKMYQKGLVYKKKTIVNWCPIDKTVLANEQVINGNCWRCSTPIKYKNLEQWFIKITNYAHELFNELNNLKYWPEKVKNMQRNWIGLSKGIKINFKIENFNSEIIEIFTTHPETVMGATYIALSVNHLLTKKILKKNFKLINFCKKNLFLNRENIKNKEGINSELFAIHPLTNDKIPIWIVNFVNINYGSGAIMGVPAHNNIDWEFARKYNLPIKPVILSSDKKQQDVNISPITTSTGILYNSGIFNGLSCNEGAKIISDFIIQKKIGSFSFQYRLHDWCISRQRYWGVPIPMIKLNNGNIIPSPEIPVILPKIGNNTCINPLKDNNFWKTIKLNGVSAQRETDTFDTFMESSWYYARYTCPNYNKGILNPKLANYWLPIDQYVGGIEHATMHLIYFRFYNKLFRDEGLVTCNEPAKRLLCQGMVLSDSFYYIKNSGEHIWVSPMEVNMKRDNNGKIIEAFDNKGNKLIYAGMSKMSKSRNNGIDPELIINKYGADTLRLFIMFAAPVEMSLEWKESGIKGIYRFLNKIWKIVYEHIQKGPIIAFNSQFLTKQNKILYISLNKTIAKVTDDIDRRQSFNTAIAHIMKLVNQLTSIKYEDEKSRSLLQKVLLSIIQMLYPFTPHICFVLFHALEKKNNIDFSLWPKVENKALYNHHSLIIIQINGKLIDLIKVPKNINKQKVWDSVLKKKKISLLLKNKIVQNIIFIPNKVFNIVVN